MTCENTTSHNRAPPVITGPVLLLICGFAFNSVPGAHSSRRATSAVRLICSLVTSKLANVAGAGRRVDLRVVRS